MNNNSIRHYFSLDKTNSTYQMLDPEAKALVEEGHFLANAYQLDKAHKNKEKNIFTASNFESILSDLSVDNRSERNKKFMEALVIYSMNKSGIETKNFTIDQIKNPMINNRKAFKENFNAVVAQILTPVIPALVSATFMDFADIVNVNYGDTARFIVRSNDQYFVTRMAEGVVGGATQRLYDNELPVNAIPYNVKTTIDWYQVAAGLFDFGLFVDRIGYAFSNYITLMVVQAITSDITTNISGSSPYFTSGFTVAKWSTLVERLSAANSGAQISAFGTKSALATIVPSQQGLQFGLGEEWAKVGHVYDFWDVPLIEVPEILLPSTVNTTALFGIPNDTVYLFANGGYKPVKIAFEGQVVTRDYDPTESADKEMGLEVTMRFGQTFVAASKYGAITGCTPS